MNAKEANALLRSAVNELIANGWIKTSIGKTLLGDNGQGHVNHWLKTDGERVNDFGIKPLTNIADQINYDLHVVFLPRENVDDIVNELNKYNYDFIIKLKTAIERYLSKQISVPKFVRNNKSKIDQVLDKLLGIETQSEESSEETPDYTNEDELSEEEKS